MGTYRFDQLFNPSSVCVVGASPRAGSVAGLVLKAVRAGYGGRLNAVNPKYDVVDAVACAPSLRRLEDPTDLVIVAVPPKAVESVIRDAIAAKAGAAIILTAGLGSGPGSIRDRIASNGLLNERRFVNGEQRALLVYGCEIDGEAPASVVRRLINIPGADHVVLKGNSRTVSGLYQLAPEAFQKLGPTSAILDLETISKVLGSTRVSDTSGDPVPKRCGDRLSGAAQQSEADPAPPA